MVITNLYIILSNDVIDLIISANKHELALYIFRKSNNMISLKVFHFVLLIQHAIGGLLCSGARVLNCSSAAQETFASARSPINGNCGAGGLNVQNSTYLQCAARCIEKKCQIFEFYTDGKVYYM